jgi:hypothetical protein
MTNHLAKISIWMFVLLFSLFLATATPPQLQQSHIDNGLQIIYPNNPYFKERVEFNLNFQAYNSTNNILYGDNVTCIISIYGKTNNILIEEELLLDTNDINRYITIHPDNITGSYEYPYIVYCNSTDEGGFIANTFTVTNYNKNENLLPVIISLGIVLLILLYFSFNIDKEHSLLKLICYIFTFIILIMIPASFFIDADIIRLLFNLTITLMSLFGAYIIFKYIFDVLRFVGIMRK